MGAIEDGGMFFVNVVLEKADQDDEEVEVVECLTAKEEYKLWMKRQEKKRETQAQLECVSVEEYISWKEREGGMIGGRAK